MFIIGWALALSVWSVWSLSWPFDPLQVGTQNLQIVTPFVARGEQLFVRLDYCKRAAISVRVDTMIEHESGALYVLKPQYPPVTTGCRNIIAPLVTLPRTLPLESTNANGSGSARVVVTYVYRINALRTITYTYPTGWFTITP